MNLRDPLFATYVVAASLIILKAVAMSWLTVFRMVKVQGGYRSPEDIKKTPLNPAPDPAQLLPNEDVERIRRIQMNDLENLPYFLVAGFLYILTQPSLLLAQWLLYGYVASRLLHFLAYLTGQIHDIRAILWTVGSLILVFMSVRTLLVALGA
ncbi:MAPEG family protein [Bradyrhizobium sp. SSUT18]|uniref:MAPEG family protein n=1 Tax=unclassified Bradyrhizobium TaxID=2631580 RepID=UPI002449CE85|nr:MULTISPECIES: MAPEG family protein [unclassified Bradyrhizobium]MDH2351374.1 MAPEG family protein [Bradyrhizobium sp. SSUT112]MDH2404277.1 MAPEG family protein [Bradyrhizobium sp. SSUT18]